MKKIQAFFAVLSVICGVGGALAFTPRDSKAPCSGGGVTLYYFTGTSNVYAKVAGVDGECQTVTSESERCYYYDPLNNHVYQPCTDLGPTKERYIPSTK